MAFYSIKQKFNKPVARLVNKPVARLVASTLIIILSLAIFITLFSIYTLSSSLNDASEINIAGSLRMQAYRLGHHVHNQDDILYADISLFDDSLQRVKNQTNKNMMLHKEIDKAFQEISTLWYQAKMKLIANDFSGYLSDLDYFVAKIDRLVMLLQEHSENKIRALALIGGGGLLIILCLVIFLIHYTKNFIVRPLNKLVDASQKVQQGEFNITLPIKYANELSLLSEHFLVMVKELKNLYFEQEERIQLKTKKLSTANNHLNVLYRCTSEISSTQITKENFSQMLKHLLDCEGIEALNLKQQHPRLTPWHVEQGIATKAPWHVILLSLDDIALGELSWQGDKDKVDQDLLDNIKRIFSRGIYYLHAQKQALRIAVMEERSSFARDLHDSIAQSLSYLKIQIAILNRTMQKEEKANKVLEDITKELNLTYEQIRMLISAFKLTSTHNNFSFALNEMLENLRRQSSLLISVDEEFIPLKLDTHSMMHVLLIIREACVNSIKHAKASKISIQCQEIDNIIKITINDDGIGFNPTENKIGHYGLSIMKERAHLLSGEFDISSASNQGCQITLTFPKRMTLQ